MKVMFNDENIDFVVSLNEESDSINKYSAGSTLEICDHILCVIGPSHH